MSALTVKWVIKFTEGEVTKLFPAEEVSVAYRDASIPENEALEVLYTPAPNGILSLCGNDPAGGAALLINPSNEKTAIRLGEGTCYVMNEAGRTIGTYQLDAVNIHGPSDQPNITSSHRNTHP